MDVYRNLTTHHTANGRSSSKQSLGSPVATPNDTQLERQAVLSGGNHVPAPSAGSRQSTNGTEPSALELQVQQLCEIFPETPQSVIESMLVRYNYNTELIASVLAAHGPDGQPSAAGTQYHCQRCSPQCSTCGGRKVGGPQRGQASDKTTPQHSPKQGQSSRVKRQHSGWGSGQSASQPLDSTIPYMTQRSSTERDSYGETDYVV